MAYRSQTTNAKLQKEEITTYQLNSILELSQYPAIRYSIPQKKE